MGRGNLTYSNASIDAWFEDSVPCSCFSCSFGLGQLGHMKTPSQLLGRYVGRGLIEDRELGRERKRRGAILFDVTVVLLPVLKDTSSTSCFGGGSPHASALEGGYLPSKQQARPR